MAGITEFILSIASIAAGTFVLISMLFQLRKSSRRLRDSYFDYKGYHSPFDIQKASVWERLVTYTSDFFEAEVEILSGAITTLANALGSAAVTLASMLSFEPKHKKAPKPTVISTKPPTGSQLFLRFTLKAKDQEVILGDLEEVFHIVGRQFGYKVARRWYIVQSIRTVFSLIVGKLAKWGVFAYITDMVRKIISP